MAEMPEAHGLVDSIVEIAPELEYLNWSTGDLLRHAVEQAPDRNALIEYSSVPEQSRSWTYAELQEAATRVAYALLKNFVPGDRIATWAAGKADLLLLQLGAALAGLTLVTLNASRVAHESREIAGA